MQIRFESKFVIPIVLVIIGVIIALVLFYPGKGTKSYGVSEGSEVQFKTNYYLLLFYIPGSPISENQLQITRKVLSESKFQNIKLHLINKNDNLTVKYNVTDFPTLILFRDSTILWREGMLSEIQLRSKLEESVT
ncbi:MAG: hypothetical protein OH319_00010 [Candidatus Parvarchaeota archaeon]|nr:hypothetical protein [Candidatus Jingweiarchaeum tengchongense]MCW1298467.1 hypothetical protein [Candidatus Jingweiarchaeum tengchongense]MCW1300559.1 hypothetical protein [Candidatus Jingweiarchaeum tengchongense]MCW1304966.1 hypothetical protein [Candidatus Jingweiarchaeum tengchongense]MCW1310015.1 hypothetical protein [Candidatus Jingweiarchaeum tengchongense]